MKIILTDEEFDQVCNGDGLRVTVVCKGYSDLFCEGWLEKTPCTNRDGYGDDEPTQEAKEKNRE